jgi:hypothetical protein
MANILATEIVFLRNPITKKTATAMAKKSYPGGHTQIRLSRYQVRNLQHGAECVSEPAVVHSYGEWKRKPDGSYVASKL